MYKIGLAGQVSDDSIHPSFFFRLDQLLLEDLEVNV